MEILPKVILIITVFVYIDFRNGVQGEIFLNEIRGYHFHTYFFQNNPNNVNEAMEFRNEIQSVIDANILEGCRLNHVNYGPRGPHPIGSFETCCNKSSISQALSWFTQNHGNLSVLLHPLTRYEVLDHTHRAMFLGQKVIVDISTLNPDLGDKVDKCLPIPPNHNDIQPFWKKQKERIR